MGGEFKADWQTYAWRWARGAFTSALAQTLALNVDWSNRDVAIKTLAISFVSGTLLALGKYIREEFTDTPVGKVANKLPL